jgi:hypothetical protein
MHGQSAAARLEVLHEHGRLVDAQHCEVQLVEAAQQQAQGAAVGVVVDVMASLQDVSAGLCLVRPPAWVRCGVMQCDAV